MIDFDDFLYFIGDGGIVDPDDTIKDIMCTSDLVDYSDLSDLLEPMDVDNVHFVSEDDSCSDYNEDNNLEPDGSNNIAFIRDPRCWDKCKTNKDRIAVRMAVIGS